MITDGSTRTTDMLRTIDTTWTQIQPGDILPGRDETESRRVVTVTPGLLGAIVGTRRTYFPSSINAQWHTEGPVTVLRSSLSIPATVCGGCGHEKRLDADSEPIRHTVCGTGRRCEV